MKKIKETGIHLLFLRLNLIKKRMCPSSFYFFFFLLVHPLQAQVILKVSVENPSEFTAQNVPVRSYLPLSIKLKNIVDVGDLEVGYDVRRGQYYVHKQVMLDPQESVSYDIVIEDVWLIDESNLAEIKTHVEKIIKAVDRSEYEEMSRNLQQEMEDDIAMIIERQNAFLVSLVGPVQHINAYKLNKELLEEVKENVSALEKLLQAVMGKGAAAQIMGEKVMGTKSGLKMMNLIRKGTYSTDMTVNAGVDCFDDQGAEIFINEDPETIVFRVGVENPSKNEAQNVRVKYMLAKELAADDVVNSDGLQIGFDFEKEVYYVFDNTVKLEAGETRNFNVEVINRWILDRIDLFALKLHTESMLAAVEGLSGFTVTKKLGKDTVDVLYALLERQEINKLSQGYVMQYREDIKTVEAVRTNVIKMEDILTRSGVMPKVTIIDERKVCEEARKLGIRGEDFNPNQKYEQKKKETPIGVLVKDVRLLAGTIFQGERLSTAATWKIIHQIIVFLFLVSGVFYFTHIKQRKNIMFDTLTASFTRAYILERLKEELKVARAAKNTCSLLILDVDKFKTINDTYGHAAGDTILKEFVVAVRKAIRATDLLGRYGGDEFLLVLPVTTQQQAKKIAQKVVEEIRAHIIHFGEERFNITTSIGVATFPEDAVTAEDLFNKADKALYVTKNKGRDGVSVFGS